MGIVNKCVLYKSTHYRISWGVYVVQATESRLLSQSKTNIWVSSSSDYHLSPIFSIDTLLNLIRSPSPFPFQHSGAAPPAEGPRVQVVQVVPGKRLQGPPGPGHLRSQVGPSLYFMWYGDLLIAPSTLSYYGACNLKGGYGWALLPVYTVLLSLLSALWLLGQVDRTYTLSDAYPI